MSFPVYNHAGKLYCCKCARMAITKCGMDLDSPRDMEYLGYELDTSLNNQYEACCACGVGLQWVKLDLIADHILSITPTYVMRAPSHQSISVSLSPWRAEDLILEVWSHLGDGFLRDIFEKDGYEFKKKDKL